MPESWPAIINTFVLAWALRTSIILRLAYQHRAREREDAHRECQNLIPRSAENQWSISIIIPAFNEELSIARSITSCINQSHTNKEIIIIDDGSTDNTHAIAKRLADDYPKKRIKIISSKCNQGKTNALNIGLSQATGSIIVTLDADTQLETRDTLTALTQPIAGNSQATAATANLRINNQATILGRFQVIEYAKIIQTIKRAQSQANAILILPGALSAFRSEPLKGIGGFSKTTLAEDADVTMALLRKGHQLALKTSACGLTEVPTSLSSFVKQRIRWRVGQWQCLWKHRAVVKQSKTTCFFYLDTIITNCMSATTPFFIVITLWQIINRDNWQSLAWAAFGFIAIDALVTGITASFEKAFRPTINTYMGSILFFATLSPLITWLSVIKLLLKRKIRW